MTMWMATWAWFSPRARVPRGAPCIFGSIQQTRIAAYAPDTPYWPQRRLRPAIWVGRQTSSRQINMSRVAPDPKMTSISAMPPDCSGTGRAHGAEYSIFCTAQAGVHQDRKEHLNFLCNLQLEVCKTLRESIADVPIERAEQQRFHPAPKSSREGTLLTNPHRQTNAARAPSQNRLPEPRLTVRHEY